MSAGVRDLSALRPRARQSPLSQHGAGVTAHGGCPRAGGTGLTPAASRRVLTCGVDLAARWRPSSGTPGSRCRSTTASPIASGLPGRTSCRGAVGRADDETVWVRRCATLSRLSTSRRSRCHRVCESRWLPRCARVATVPAHRRGFAVSAAATAPVPAAGDIDHALRIRCIDDEWTM